MFIGLAIIAVLILAAGVFLLLIRLWQKIPEGKLEWKLALILRLVRNAEEGRKAEIDDVDQYRKQSNENMLRFIDPCTELAAAEDIDIPGSAGTIPARMFRPAGSAKTAGLPVLMYYHGGGFVVGSIGTHDPLCRILSAGAGAIVISVGYRLAPEHPWPAAPSDCYSALIWASENASGFGGDPDNISVAGDSAGGNLATVTAILAKENGGPDIRSQVLIYPNTNGCFMGMPSHEMYGMGFFLDMRQILWYCDQYVPNPEDRVHPHASPLKAADFAGLPPALIITAQCDPLRDEGKAYADKLTAAGVPVSYQCYPGVTHGFICMPKLCRAAGKATELIVRKLRELKPAEEEADAVKSLD